MKSWQKLPKVTKRHQKLPKVGKSYQKLPKVGKVTSLSLSLLYGLSTMSQSVQFVSIRFVHCLYELSSDWIRDPNIHVILQYRYQYCYIYEMKQTSTTVGTILYSYLFVVQATLGGQYLVRLLQLVLKV